MKRVIIGTIVALGLVAAGVGVARAGRVDRPVALEAGSAAATATFDVEGVDCAACTLAIHRAVKKLDGVRDVRSGKSKSQLVVAYDPHRVTPQRILKAIKDAGYSAKIAS